MPHRSTRTAVSKAPGHHRKHAKVVNQSPDCAAIIRLPIARTFVNVVSTALLTPCASVLIVLDVDHFRSFRILHGVRAAQALLRAVGRRLARAALLEGGTFMHLGADEFAILLPVPSGTAEAAIRLCAKTLLDAASRPFLHCGTSYAFSATAGLVHLPLGPGTSAAELLRCCRLAVIQGKQAGGGGVMHCHPGQFAEAEGREQLGGDLASAIRQGQIVPFYQPVVDLTTGQVTGMEVLARWLHPRLGLLPPDRFIPLAEEQALCCALTRSLLQQVRRDAAAWPRHWTFAFNAAPRELLDLLTFIATAGTAAAGVTASGVTASGVTASGAPGPGALAPHRIELEVTETALVGDLSQSCELIAALIPAGVKIVLDDFGTGSANFRQLCQIPFSRLKIDKSFVTHMLDDPRAEACVRAIIELAHHLGMTATAEGVESGAVAQRLATLGCDHAQGYHYARPMPAAELTRLWVGSGLPARRGVLAAAV
jgi:predicted signal transduction protein with EAL and GGDEF domain